MIITTALYDAVLHLNIYEWQRKHGLLTEEVQADYLEGIVRPSRRRRPANLIR